MNLSGINLTLINYLNSRNSSYPHPARKKTLNFLNMDADDYENRQNVALDITQTILRRHQKDDIPEIARKLADLERNLEDLMPYQRDHVCHSVLTCLLGYFIIDSLKLHQTSGFLFEWKLASLLHDIGYVIQALDNMGDDFFKDYEEGLLDEEYVPFSSQAFKFKRYLQLYTSRANPTRDTLTIYQNRVNSWRQEFNVKQIFSDFSESRKFDNNQYRTDHGICSSILVMRAIDKKYKDNNPEQKIKLGDPWSFKYIENEIVNACLSIFIHNLNHEKIIWDFHRMRSATLLKVCDELQDWSRPLHKKPKGYPPKYYDINVIADKIVFYVHHSRYDEIVSGISNVTHFPMSIMKLEKNDKKVA